MFSRLQENAKYWDYLKGHLFWAPISGAQIIPQTARDFVNNRTTKELILIVSQVEELLDNLFDSDIQRVKAQLIHDQNFEMAELDKDGQIVDLLDVAKDHYGLIDQNYPNVWALQNVFSDCDFDIFFFPNTYEQPKEYEVWAALSLAGYANYVYSLDHKFSFKKRKFEKRRLKKYESHEIVSFTNQLLESQEMLIHATANYTKFKVDDQTKKQKQREEKQLAINRKIRSQNANISRHAKTNELKEKIQSEWESNLNTFSSIKEAGDFYADAMAMQGNTIEPETVRRYISEKASKIGFSYKPKSKKLSKNST